MACAPLSLAPSPMNFIVPENANAVTPPASGMIAWWRASDLPLAQYVLAWANAVGGGQSLDDVFVNDQFALCDIFGGIKSVQLSPDDDYLATASAVWTGNAARTMIVVWKNNATAVQRYICGQASSLSSGAWGLFANPGADSYLWNNGSAMHPNWPLSTAWQATIATYDGGTAATSGTLRSSLTSGVYNYSAAITQLDTESVPFRVGYDPVIGDTCDCFIAEIICYNRVLTAGEIATVQAYILTKFGITYP